MIVRLRGAEAPLFHGAFHGLVAFYLRSDFMVAVAFPVPHFVSMEGCFDSPLSMTERGELDPAGTLHRSLGAKKSPQDDKSRR